MSEIVVLGSLNMDLVVKAPRLPRPGETISGYDFQMIPGGKGANQAAAVARLGGKVAMIGRVGGDVFGERLRENMLRFGVNVENVTVDKEAGTGIALITVDTSSGQNTIVINAGANGRVSIDDLKRAESLFREAKMLILQFEVPLQAVEEATEVAKQHGLQVVLNPAPAYPVSMEFLRKVDYLVLNETEAGILTQKEIDGLQSAQIAAEELVSGNISVVIITLGEKGALLVTSQEIIHVPAKKVEVVDATAAGDAFVAALSVALLKGFSLPQAVYYATCAGTLTVTRFGAQTSLPSEEEVRTFCDEDQL